MKKTKRITRLFVETENVFVFRSRDAVQRGWCVECGTETSMATLPEAAREAQLTELKLCQLIEAHAIHFREEEGHVLICLNSLLK